MSYSVHLYCTCFFHLMLLSSHFPVHNEVSILSSNAGVSNPRPTDPMRSRMAMNAAQRKIVIYLKHWFYYLDRYIFCISDHKLETCSMIVKDYQEGRYIIRVII